MGAKIGYVEGYETNKPQKKSRLVELANRDRDANRALMFSALIFSNEDAHLSRMLTEQAYYTALNSITGDLLALYYHYQERKINVRRNLNNRNEYYPADSSSINKFKEEFSLTSSCPLLFFFQVNQSDVVNQVVIRLKGNNLEECYNEIYKYIIAVTNTLKQISRKYKYNYGEIFDLVNYELKSGATTDIIGIALKHIPFSSFLKNFFDHIVINNSIYAYPYRIWI